MGDAHDVRGGSNGAQREPLTKGEPAAEATSATVLALATAADLSRPSTRAPPGTATRRHGTLPRAAGRRGRRPSGPPTRAGARPRRRWRGATAPRPSRRCAPRTPPRPVSARGRCRQSAEPWRAARASSYRPPRRSRPPASHRRPGRTWASPRASSRSCSTSRAARRTARSPTRSISACAPWASTSHILGKLSAVKRGEAAAIAHRLGLAP
jgi:hypothetical protein